MSETTKEGAEMEAGRDLDVVIAERVMGAAWVATSDPQWQILRPEPDGNILALRERDTGRIVQYGESWDEEYLPGYSTNIAAAWGVVEAMRARGYAVFVGGRPDAWEVEIVGPGGLSWRNDDQPSAPLAICRAALAALDAA